ncbi:MAG: TRAP transporter small permease [Spirochaetes bacterium]|nr:TRAP transporter small permease [Spirochaetota bacterium]
MENEVRHSRLELLFQRLNKGVGYAAGIGNLVMGILLFVEVVLRYIFHSPTTWSQEVAIYIFTWTMFAGAAYTLSVGKHIHIDVLVSRLPEKPRRLIEVCTGLLGFLFCAYVTYQAWNFVVLAIQMKKLSATTLRVPIWTIEASVLVGFLLLCIQYMFIVLDRVHKMVKKEGLG